MPDREIKNLDIMERVVLLEERTRNLQIKVNDIDSTIKSSFETMEEKLDEIISFRDKIDGGWKVIAWVGGVVLFVSALMSWVFDRWTVIKESLFG